MHVLEHLRLGVHAIPGHLQGLREEQLQQAVMADHLQRDPAPRGRQPHTAVGRARDQALAVELA